MIQYLILLAAAFVGGASNALAGGGTFLTFPALLLVGVPPVKANATASLVLLPGAFASAWVYRDTIKNTAARTLGFLSVASLIGSVAGSILLLMTSNSTFSNLVPWLLLTAAAVFTLAPWIRKVAVRQHSHHHGSDSIAGLLAGQLVISVYGGYFGAGMGVLMIALYLVATNLDVHSASGLRMVCACMINTLAVAIFAWRGALDYRVGVPMLLLGVVGGYIGAILVKRLNAQHARVTILVYAWVLTVWFFGRLYL